MRFNRLPSDQIYCAMSETAKYRHLTAKWCYTDGGVPGVGVDIASQGDRVVPWAISFDLPVDEFNKYCSNHPPFGTIHLRGHATRLPFENNSLDFVYSSHLLEDYEDWEPVMREWNRVLKPQGYMIVIVPDKERWAKAIEVGQTPNCSHRHEATLGELSDHATRLGMEVMEEFHTDEFPGDYSILGIFRKQ